MNHNNRHKQIEFGDFQTPLELAEQICKKLQDLGVSPNVIMEPTCGQGNFLLAAHRHFLELQQLIGVEIDPKYLEQARQNLASVASSSLELHQGDFFAFDWQQLLERLSGKLLILGNLPWVTNSQLGTLGSNNLPNKTNFQEKDGISAITGSGNFDISEWMLLRIMDWLKSCGGTMAILCKTHTARKTLEQLYRWQASPASATIYLVDAQEHFRAAVDACLLVCTFAPGVHLNEYEIYAALDGPLISRVGYRHGHPIRDLLAYDAVSELYGQSKLTWRSGIKHDCAKVMELSQTPSGLTNALGETVQIEPKFVFPLLKGSDVANGRVAIADRFVLVPQTTVGQPTTHLQLSAPRTWDYLLAHADYLDQRKSQIYRTNPRFSIFGVGDYTFAPWKIAISALYKHLTFRLVGPINDKPVVFDDTVYYLSFKQESEARTVLELLNRKDVQQFYHASIFWDEKRPIKATILNRLALHRLMQSMTSSGEDLPLFQSIPSQPHT
jgi:hypothetical protein